MAEIYPEAGRFAAVFHELLVLVDGDASLLPSTTDGPRLGVVVPDDVFTRWQETKQQPAAAGVTRARKPRKE